MTELERPLDDPLARRASRDARPAPAAAIKRVPEQPCTSFRHHQLELTNIVCDAGSQMHPSIETLTFAWLSQERTGVLGGPRGHALLQSLQLLCSCLGCLHGCTKPADVPYPVEANTVCYIAMPHTIHASRGYALRHIAVSGRTG